MKLEEELVEEIKKELLEQFYEVIGQHPWHDRWVKGIFGAVGMNNRDFIEQAKRNLANYLCPGLENRARAAAEKIFKKVLMRMSTKVSSQEEDSSSKQ